MHWTQLFVTDEHSSPVAQSPLLTQPTHRFVVVSQIGVVPEQSELASQMSAGSTHALSVQVLRLLWQSVAVLQATHVLPPVRQTGVAPEHCESDVQLVAGVPPSADTQTAATHVWPLLQSRFVVQVVDVGVATHCWLMHDCPEGQSPLKMQPTPLSAPASMPLSPSI